MRRLWQKFCALACSKTAQEKYLVNLETPRLLLREFEWGDVDRIHDISKTPGFVYYCFDGTREKAKDFVQLAIDTQMPDLRRGKRTDILLAVVEKTSGTLVGHASIESVDHRDGVDDYEFNFFIDPAHQRSGYGREACANLMRYGFEDFGLDDFIVTIHPDNKASQAVARKEGYVKVGETTIYTEAGTEPRDLLVLDKQGFYDVRAKDKKPMFLPDATPPTPPAPKPPEPNT